MRPKPIRLLSRIAMMLFMMLLTTTTAWATTTSSINVGGTDYVLFTGFTATDGTAVDNVFVYGNVVDGNTSTSWHIHRAVTRLSSSTPTTLSFRRATSLTPTMQTATNPLAGC